MTAIRRRRRYIGWHRADAPTPRPPAPCDPWAVGEAYDWRTETRILPTLGGA